MDQAFKTQKNSNNSENSHETGTFNNCLDQKLQSPIQKLELNGSILGKLGPKESLLSPKMTTNLNS